MRDVHDKLLEITIWNSDPLDGAVGLHKDIKEYLQLWDAPKTGMNWIFSIVKVKAHKNTACLKREQLGREDILPDCQLDVLIIA